MTHGMLWRAALILVISLTLATASTAAPSPGPSSLSQPVTLVQWVLPRFKLVPGYESQTPQFGDWEKIVAAVFRQQHPNVTVDIQVIPFDGSLQKIGTAIAA